MTMTHPTPEQTPETDKLLPWSWVSGKFEPKLTQQECVMLVDHARSLETRLRTAMEERSKIVLANAEVVNALSERAERAEADAAQMREQLEAARALLTRYRNETPLGHQPHMIAHEVDTFLAPAIQSTKEDK